jgi:hypothetical protein
MMTCTALTVTGFIAITFAAIAIILLPSKPKSRLVASGIVLVLATFTFSAGVALTVAASRAGLETDYDSTVSEIAEAMSYGIHDSSPMCTSDPMLPEGTIAVVFRYDCPDCKATLSDLKAWAYRTNANIVFVSSRMPGGKRLTEAAHITEVPSVVCVDPSTGEFAWRVAYKTVDGSTQVDESGLDAILKIATNKKQDA